MRMEMRGRLAMCVNMNRKKCGQTEAGPNRFSKSSKPEKMKQTLGPSQIELGAARGEQIAQPLAGFIWREMESKINIE